MEQPAPASVTIGRALPLPRIGLGTGLHGEVSERQSVATIEHALHRGVRFFDTAPLYGNGLAEERLGIALHGVPRDSYVLNTKVGILSGGVTGGFDYDFSADGVERCFARSLRRLRVERIDILHLHEPEGFGEQVLAETLPLVLRWREQGLMRALSAGVNHWSMAEPFVEHLDCVLLAGRYTLLEQGALAVPRAPAAGAAAGARGRHLQQRHPGHRPGEDARYNYLPAPGPVRDRVRRLQQVCVRHGVELSHAAVQFVAAQPAVGSLIFGACSGAELDQALRGTRPGIPPALWEELRTEELLDPAAPVPEPE